MTPLTLIRERFARITDLDELRRFWSEDLGSDWQKDPETIAAAKRRAEELKVEHSSHNNSR